MRVKPLSIKKIREITQVMRDVSDTTNLAYFPVVEVVELFLPRVLPNFSFEVLCKKDLEDRLGLTYPDRPAIYIRDDIYQKAIAGEGLGRFTFAHELGHLLLHEASFARNVSTAKPIKAYEDSEWQANTFAAELLMPLSIVRGKGIQEISKLCGVSKKAASVRITKLQKEVSRNPNWH